MDEDGNVPTTCFDYCCLRDHPEGESVLVMVGREKRSKMVLADMGPFKGGGVDGLVGQLLRDLKKMVPTEKSFEERPRDRHLGCPQRCLQAEGKRERFSSVPSGVKSKGRI